MLVAVDNERGILTCEKSVEELTELALTAGVDAVATVIQKREKAHPATYVGTGKIDEIKVIIDETDADLIITDDELSPAQIRNLSRALKIKVIDRTTLILDIFASRAQSREGKIQVELAQQRYRLSHLVGQYEELSKLGGGIGTRGPGEKKLETDKRHIRETISNLKAELLEIERHRGVLRQNSQKQGLPVVSMVGYTNAGKSTLLNAITDADVYAENKLFATLDTTTRRLKLPAGSFVQFTDTVGFINKLPHQLIKAFKATLDELKYADILIHVVDASNDEYKNHMKVVNEVITDLGLGQKPVITVFNKIDKCEMFMPVGGKDETSINSISISAAQKIGIGKFLSKIEDVLKNMRRKMKVILPYEEGGLLNLVHGKCEIISQEHGEDGVLMEAYVTDEIYSKLDKYKV